MKNSVLTVLFLGLLLGTVSAQKVISKQTKGKTTSSKPTKQTTLPAAVEKPKAEAAQPQMSGKSSAAFAELALRKAEVEAVLKDLLQDYTEEYPEAKKKQMEINLLQKEMQILAKADAKTVPKLSVAVGKLLVKKIEIQMELETLRQDYTEDYPLVQKTKRRLQSFEREINELLQ